MSEPWGSIIVVSYNNERFLAAAIDSARKPATRLSLCPSPEAVVTGLHQDQGEWQRVYLRSKIPFSL